MFAALVWLALSLAPHLAGGCPVQPNRPVPREISPDPVPTRVAPQE